MNIDFKNIQYLKLGNSKQKEIYRIVNEYNLLEILKDYSPIIVGTFPININIENSDIDIILQVQNMKVLEDLLITNFSKFRYFKSTLLDNNNFVCNFIIENYPFEIFAQNLKTEKQYGYLHMIKEYKILASEDENFAEKIRELKRNGIKTEPAFCSMLNIKGNPYIELLSYEIK